MEHSFRFHFFHKRNHNHHHNKTISLFFFWSCRKHKPYKNGKIESVGLLSLPLMRKPGSPFRTYFCALVVVKITLYAGGVSELLLMLSWVALSCWNGIYVSEFCKWVLFWLFTFTTGTYTKHQVYKAVSGVKYIMTDIFSQNLSRFFVLCYAMMVKVCLGITYGTSVCKDRISGCRGSGCLGWK